MIRGVITVCKGCKQKKSLWVTGLCRRCYDNKNRIRIRERSSEWRNRNREKLRIQRDIRRYGVAREVIFERDNWVCQDCGMGVQEHIEKWTNSFDIHHIDGNGIYSDKPNNDIKNLVTLCCSCHCKRDKDMQAIKKWGKLAEQDDSEWRFPKIRELVQKEAKILGTLHKAKAKVANDFDTGFYTIDHKYYERKCVLVLGDEHDE